MQAAQVAEEKGREQLEREYELSCELERIACEESFEKFVRAAWHVLEPEFPLVWNWHLELLCEEVQKQIERIARREPRKYHLLINIPPRSLKSWFFTRAPAAWTWIRFPWMRFMTVSYAEELALEHAVDTRTLIQSDWYQDRWGDRYSLMPDQNVKSFYKTSQLGYRMTGSVGGKAIGRGGHIITIDDPLSPEEAEYDVARDTVIRWFSRTIKSRLSNPTIGMFWIVMQRLHEDDLSGYVLRMEGEKWKHICLPAVDGPQVRPLEYRSKYVNGLLFPEQFPQDFLDGMKATDAYMFAGQYLQLPSPPEGGMFKRQWWRFWKPEGMNLPAVVVQIGSEVHTCPVVDLPETFDDVINSWDMGLKEHKESDPLAGEAWAAKGPNFFLLDIRRDRMDPLKAAQAAKELRMLFPQTSAVLIEDTAGGSSAIVDLKRTIPGVIGVVPKGDKRTRAIPMSRCCQAGNLYLPHPALAPWVDAFIDEYAAFDKGTHDDQVDAGDQSINYFLGHRKVWADYRGESTTFKVQFGDLPESSVLIISQWVEQDLTSSVLMSWWSKRTNTLWIFDEFVSDTPRAEIVVAGVLASLRRDSDSYFNKLLDLKKFIWWGNSLMSSKGQMGDTIEAYRKYKLAIRSPLSYDEFGSCVRVSLLMSRKTLKIHSRCAGLIQQAQEWSIENKRPADKHGLCRTMCQTVSVLWESGAMRQQDKPMKEYSRKKTKHYEEIDRASANGTLAQIVAGQRVPGKGDKSGFIV